MNSLKAGDGDASERDLLVDDIQRIREVLHLGGEKLSSDEEDDSEEEDEEEEDEVENEEHGLNGNTLDKLQSLTVDTLSTQVNGRIGTLVEVVESKNEEDFDNTRKEIIPISNQDVASEPIEEHHLQEQLNLFSDHESIDNTSTEYTLAELQPVQFDSTSGFLSPSHAKQDEAEWQVEFTINQVPEPDQTQEEAFSCVGDVNDGDSEMKRGITACLELNRDYQMAILDELERIELALAKNKEKQLGLHQMRANREEGKQEPQTLITFSNPYFRDKNGVGAPDNEDTKSNRQSCQVGGYEIPSRAWLAREKHLLAEGVRMQNLELKLSPVLEKIHNLEQKNTKTDKDLQELESLRSKTSQIKNLPTETFERDLDGIDWDRLSSSYLPRRTGVECRLQWCNFGHPEVNLTQWTKEEDKVMIQLAKGQDTWDVIAQKLQTKRTPINCYQRYQRSLNKNLLKSKWTPEDDQRLIELVRVVGVGNWSRVAGFMEGRMGDQCLHRYTQTLKLSKKGKWSKEEDELLKKAVSKYGPANWYKMAEWVTGRSGSQCRERWMNSLDPKINKGEWSKDQDNRLLEHVEKFGKGNWSKIARAQGDRTDNQCWRRWMVINKDEFLHYRQNVLRKKKELVANFTGRKRERPSLQPEDLDIPDLPVVRKRRGRLPLPPAESKKRRRMTLKKYREKKKAKKKQAEKAKKKAEKASKEKSAPTTQATTQSTTPTRKRKPVRYVESSDSEDDDDDDGVVDDDSDSSSSDDVQVQQKSPHTRKAGANRDRVQMPHHRVLMKNKQLTKRKEVAQKRDKRHSDNTDSEKPGGEKKVAVSGSLAPFSLLLQAFSIDIPTVLQAIQQGSATSSSPLPSGNGTAAASSTSTTPSGNITATTSSTSPPPSGNVTAAVVPPESQEHVTKERPDLQKSNDPACDHKQQENDVSGIVVSQSQASAPVEGRGVVSTGAIKDVISTSEKENSNSVERPCHKQQEECQKSNRIVIRGNQAKPNAEEIVSGASSNKVQTAQGSQDPVRTGHRPCANRQTPPTASRTGQAPPRKAPAIPPLPPCCTTLKAFRSLQQLRPHLEQLAAMLHACPGGNTVATQASHSSESGVTRDNIVKSHGTARDRHVLLPDRERPGVEPGPTQASHSSESGVTRDNVVKSHGTARDRHMVLPDRERPGVEPGQKELPVSANRIAANNISSGNQGSVSRDCVKNKEGDKSEPEPSPKRNPSVSSSAGDTLARHASSSTNISSCVQGDSVTTFLESRRASAPVIDLTSDQECATKSLSQSTTNTADQATVQTDGQGNKRTRLGTHAHNFRYRNSYTHKLLSSRFNSLFLWPALLSNVSPHKGSLIISNPTRSAQVFAEKHPPPKSGFHSTTVPYRAQKRKAPTRGKSPVRRKRRGLAAVRMASSASMGTIAQQMLTEGQGSAIRSDAGAASKRVEPSVAEKTSAVDSSVSRGKASRLGSDTEAAAGSRSSAESSSCNTPEKTSKRKRKSVPAKTRKSSRIQANSLREIRESVGRVPSPESASHTTTDLVNGTCPTPLNKSPQPSNTRSSSPSTANKRVGSQRSVGLSSPPSRAASPDYIDLRSPESGEQQPSLRAEYDGKPAQNDETADVLSDGATDQCLSTGGKNAVLSPGSSKRKPPFPRRREANKGARWRAMLPNTDPDEGNSV